MKRRSISPDLCFSGAILNGIAPPSSSRPYPSSATILPATNTGTARTSKGACVICTRGRCPFSPAICGDCRAKKGFNTEGDLEVPPAALEELVVNMLLHRDYFISAPWRVMLFDNRIELISPGALPNNLTVENIRNGVSNHPQPSDCLFCNQRQRTALSGHRHGHPTGAGGCPGLWNWNRTTNATCLRHGYREA